MPWWDVHRERTVLGQRDGSVLLGQEDRPVVLAHLRRPTRKWPSGGPSQRHTGRWSKPADGCRHRSRCCTQKGRQFRQSNDLQRNKQINEKLIHFIILTLWYWLAYKSYALKIYKSEKVYLDKQSTSSLNCQRSTNWAIWTTLAGTILSENILNALQTDSI